MICNPDSSVAGCTASRTDAAASRAEREAVAQILGCIG
jgi:hypothetical protein